MSSLPWHCTDPAVLAAVGNKPRTPRPSVDLPHPDSPTRPRVSPLRRSKLTPSTARTAPRGVPYQTLRSLTLSTVSLPGVVTDRSDTDIAAALLCCRVGDGHRQQSPAPQCGVDQVVEALAHQGEPGHQQDDRQAWVDRGPPHATTRLAEGTLQVVPPLGSVGRLNAVAQKPQSCQGKQGISGVERRDDRDVLHHVAEDVPADDGTGTGAEHLSSLDVGLLAHADDAVADDPEVLRHIDNRDGKGCGHHPAEPWPQPVELATEVDRHQDRQQQRGEG